MRKILGIGGLFLVVCVVMSLCNDVFFTSGNISNLIRRSSLYGLISIGVAFVINTGGIDLSIGSVIGLVGTLVPWLLVEHDLSPFLVLPLMLLLCLAMGLAHGLLITKLRLQPFLVTLCGLLIYRGLARGIVDDAKLGFGVEFAGLRSLATGSLSIGSFELPTPFFILLVIGLLAAYLLQATVFGRYLQALGRNEVATRYSGIDTDKTTIGAYMISSCIAGLAGLLFVFENNSADPSAFGNFYELYAIAGAVLGGCALRGGEGSILGVILGASLVQVLRNIPRLVDWIPASVEFAFIGLVILAGVVVDELVRRFAGRDSS